MKKPKKLTKTQQLEEQIELLKREHQAYVDGLGSRYNEQIKANARGILTKELTATQREAEFAEKLGTYLRRHETILKDALKQLGVEL